MDAKQQKKVQEQISAAASIVDDMMKHVTEKLFLETASNYISGEGATGEQLANAVKEVVTPQLESLTEFFLPTLDGIMQDLAENDSVQMPEEMRQQMFNLLACIKDEVLAQLSQRMPPELLIIQELLGLQGGAEQRTAMLKNPDKKWSTDGVLMTVTKVISDFEGIDDGDGAGEGENMPPPPLQDPQLLAKLCIIREELRQLVDEEKMLNVGKTQTQSVVEVITDDGDVMVIDDDSNDSNDNGTTQEDVHPYSLSSSPYTAVRSVPTREIGFLKEVMSVGSSEQRRGLIEAAIRGDVKAVGPIGACIRPGAFMDCIKAVQVEMLGSRNEATTWNEGVLLRLEDVWRETLIVLEDVSGDSKNKYTP